MSENTTPKPTKDISPRFEMLLVLTFIFCMVVLSALLLAADKDFAAEITRFVTTVAIANLAIGAVCGLAAMVMAKLNKSELAIDILKAASKVTIIVGCGALILDFGCVLLAGLLELVRGF